VRSSLQICSPFPNNRATHAHLHADTFSIGAASYLRYSYRTSVMSSTWAGEKRCDGVRVLAATQLEQLVVLTLRLNVVGEGKVNADVAVECGVPPRVRVEGDEPLALELP
jgi:hypothetical protein